MRYIRKINGVVEEYLKIKNLGESYFTKNGYVKYNGNHPIQYLDIVDGEIVELEIPEIETEKIFTKNQIRTACRELGIEDKLNEILSISADFKTFWDECLEVDFNYPMTQQALAVSKFTDDDIQNIITYIELHNVI